MQFVLISLGGAVGCLIRYFMVDALTYVSTASRFPVGTFIVNVFGCVVIGFLGAISDTRGGFSPEARALVFTGLLGGFTTFSAFGYETFTLIRQDELFLAVYNVIGQVVLGLTSVWFGFKVGGLVQ